MNLERANSGVLGDGSPPAGSKAEADDFSQLKDYLDVTYCILGEAAWPLAPSPLKSASEEVARTVLLNTDSLPCECRYENQKNRLEELPTDKFSVVVGAHRIQENETSQRRHEIKRSVVHEKYLSTYPQNDIWLIQVDPPIEFNRNVSAICVDSSVFPTQTRCYVTGWGTTSPFVDADRKHRRRQLRYRTAISADIGHLWPLRTFSITHTHPHGVA